MREVQTANQSLSLRRPYDLQGRSQSQNRVIAAKGKVQEESKVIEGTVNFPKNPVVIDKQRRLAEFRKYQ